MAPAKPHPRGEVEGDKDDHAPVTYGHEQMRFTGYGFALATGCPHSFVRVLLKLCCVVSQLERFELVLSGRLLILPSIKLHLGNN